MLSLPSVRELQSALLNERVMESLPGSRPPLSSPRRQKEREFWSQLACFFIYKRGELLLSLIPPPPAQTRSSSHEAPTALYTGRRHVTTPTV